MGVIVFLVVLALLIAGGFLVSFFWATKDGQFDDTYTPAVRILFDSEKKASVPETSSSPKDSEGQTLPSAEPLNIQKK